MDYGFSERRKNRNDKRAKSRFNRYKKGGALRVQKLEDKGKNK
jgi:hypothetical protein